MWLPEGVVNEEEAARAKGVGLLVVMDRCMPKEHKKLKENPAKVRCTVIRK